MRNGTLFVVGFSFFMWAASAWAQAPKLEALRARAKESTKDSSVALLLGQAERKAGHYELARSALRRGIADLDATFGLAIALRYEIARTFLDEHKFGEATTACKAVGAVSGGEALGHACLAANHMTRRRASEALPEAELALGLSPALYEARVVKSDALALDGSVAEAERLLREAAESRPRSVEAWQRLGELLDAQGRHPAALEAFRRARDADPDDPDAAFALGRALAPSRDAAAPLLQAVNGRPTFGAAWAELAEVELAGGRLGEAEKDAKQAIALDANQAGWRTTLARIYAEAGRDDEALSESRAALLLVKNLGAAKLVEADVLAHKGEIDLALEAYQTAFGFARSDPSALVHASHACLTANRETSALSFAERATELFPKWGPGFVALGDVLAKGKDSSAARQAYKNALSGEGPVDAASVEKKIAALK